MHPCMCVCSASSVVYNSLRSHGLQPGQAALSMGFSRQKCWSWLPCSLPDLPDPGMEPASLKSAGRFLLLVTSGKADAPTPSVFIQNPSIVSCLQHRCFFFKYSEYEFFTCFESSHLSKFSQRQQCRACVWWGGDRSKGHTGLRTEQDMVNLNTYTTDISSQLCQMTTCILCFVFTFSFQFLSLFLSFYVHFTYYLLYWKKYILLFAIIFPHLTFLINP